MAAGTRQLHHAAADTSLCDKQHAHHALFLQWWCNYDPATGKERTKPKDAELSGPAAAANAARVLEWYIKEGHKGYKVGEEVEEGGWEEVC